MVAEERHGTSDAYHNLRHNPGQVEAAAAEPVTNRHHHDCTVCSHLDPDSGMHQTSRSGPEAVVRIGRRQEHCSSCRVVDSRRCDQVAIASVVDIGCLTDCLDRLHRRRCRDLDLIALEE